MFNPSDIYVSGASDELLACWTDKVTKYDASSFYNWEQDNLPLHDLEERTHLLWEKFGHPTSALTGMSFVVSADATSSCSPLYFKTLSACIDALPEVINYPILVEVASFGNLGGLNLSNKSFGPNGALEIINRNSAFAYPGSMSSVREDYNRYELDDGFTDYALASSVALAGTFALTLAGFGFQYRYPCPSIDHIVNRIYTTDTLVASGVGADLWQDERFVNPYVFVKRFDGKYGNRLTAALSSTVDPYPVGVSSFSTALRLPFEAYDKNNSDAVYDVSTIDTLEDSQIIWGHQFDSDGPQYAVMSFSYFNSLEYVKVNNCNGPVYIRNFNIDGQNKVDRGVEIKNSQVNLERTSVSRCNKAGLYVDNSEVNILKGIVAYRNYENTDSTRVGIPFEEKRRAYRTQEEYGAGIYANNSTINFKDTYARDLEQYGAVSGDGSFPYGDPAGYRSGLLIYEALPGVGYPTGSLANTFIPNPSKQDLICLSRNDIGIHAVNSLIKGGRTELNGNAVGGAYARWDDAMSIQSELNTEAGIKLENSVLDIDGRILVEGNFFGLDSVNSELNVDSFAARYNQSTGVKLDSSVFKYNNNMYAGILQASPTAVLNYLEAQVLCYRNGQALTCDNSEVGPFYTSSMPSLYSMFYASGCFGKEIATDKLLPSIHVTNNSNVDLVHAHLKRVPPNVGDTSSAQYGLLAHVEDDSTLTMRGSGQYANIVLGPTERGASVNVAGLYANNHSNIKIQGPTTIGRFGVDVLAEDNSNIEITPHQSNNGTLLVSSFDLNNGDNHTMVELHSTRACLVANRDSSILMENLGDYQAHWGEGAYASALTERQDYLKDDYPAYASAGYVQFYPNANVSAATVQANPANVAGSNKYVFESGGTDPASKYYLIHTLGNPASAVTTGGMCVRALGDSFVQANNVHFPATWDNTSAVVYDLDGDDPLPGPNCSRLFIWNIADSSLLKASYLTVSGTHPRDTGYHGPSGTWGVSAAPSSTPDTSSLSVLDYYGQGSANFFGKSGYENKGAFRLYFSTDPAANFLVASGANPLDGFARQVFAQGYNFSGNLIASSSDDYEASAQYISVLQYDVDGNIHPSGFYYASSMLTSPGSTKAILEDSALNTFANAKHNMVGKSGLAKVVEGYYATSAFGGDSYNEYTYGTGLASINNFDLKKDN